MLMAYQVEWLIQIGGSIVGRTSLTLRQTHHELYQETPQAETVHSLSTQ